MAEAHTVGDAEGCRRWSPLVVFVPLLAFYLGATLLLRLTGR